MGRPADPVYQQRNDKMIAEYQGDTRVTLFELSQNSGLSKLQVRRILEDAGVTIRPEPRRTRADNRYRNNHLVAMGARLHAERMRRQLSMVEMAVGLGLSEANLGAALQGLYNWKFIEMARAAKFLGVTLEEFVKLPEGMKEPSTTRPNDISGP